MTAAAAPIVWVLALLAVIMGACGTPSERSSAQRLLEVCETYSGVLAALAVQRQLGNLSEAQINAVDEVRVIANPTCAGDHFATPELELGVLLAEVEMGVTRLILIRREAERREVPRP